MIPPEKKPIMLFELGHLMVYCYQTLEEWSAGAVPTEVFWQKKDDGTTRGPFASVYVAVNDYSEFIKPKVQTPDNLIMVDFKTKRRVK